MAGFGVDFSPLGDLYNTYQQSRQRAVRDQVLGSLGQGTGPLDYGAASKALLAAGDTEGGLSLAKLAQQQYLTSPEYITQSETAKAKVAADYAPKTFEVSVPGAFGETVKQTVEKGPNGYRAINVQPAPGMTDASGAPMASGGPTSAYLAPGIAKVNSGLSGEAYLGQFSPEVKAAVKNYLDGNTMPTGNPRQQGLANIAKTIAQKYGPEVGVPADDAAFAARRKMLVDLAASSPNSTGGIISNGKSAFEHLANLSDKMIDLGNYSFNVPFGGPAAQAANYIGNVVAPTSETKGKITSFGDNALKYGQEATKFYAGSGGGEGERMAALRTLDPTKSSSEEQAGYLQTEKELMLGRLRAKEAQIRDTLGQGYLDRHPVMTPDLSDVLNKIDANMAKLRGQQPPPPVEYAPKSAPPPAPQTQAQPDPNAWKNRDTITAARSNPQQAIAEAQAAIKAGADPKVVMQRLQAIGIPIGQQAPQQQAPQMAPGSAGAIY
jgi:hypothetical protein